jgi:DNA-binding protein WhiA
VLLEGVELGVVERRSHAAAYAKGIDTIAGALALAGASDSALAFEERSVVGDTRSSANRLANADHANLVRTSRAAHVQLEAIQRLRAAGALDALETELQDAAGLRLRYPTLPLSQLSARSGISKPSLARRLAAIVALAEE